jgi:Ca-activated chloride channel family protein
MKRLFAALYATVAVLTAVAAFLIASPAALAQGMLVPRDENLDPLELRRHTVEFRVHDNAAVTHVTQVFRNHTSSQLEATYYFAIPEGSVTTDFALWMNGERIEGEVLPREQARAAYETIVRRMRDPGLLEYVDGELFQASIFPIPANGEQTVEIEYASVLSRRSNTVAYTYPIHESAGEIGLFSVHGDIIASGSMADIYAPYHRVDVDWNSDRTTAVIDMESTNLDPTKDFELFIGLDADDVGISLITFDGDDGEEGYFMLTLTPTEELEAMGPTPKQVTFVVDTSGSMAGEKFEQAQNMLRYCLENLNPDDTFQLITFSSDVDALFDEPQPATREKVRQALAWVDELRASGNTNISGALERALDDPASPDRPHAIIFATDGLPTQGIEDTDGIVEIVRRGVSDGDRRIFAFGVGYDVNTHLLDGIARRGRGQTGYVLPHDDISDVVGGFYDRVSTPLLTRIELDFGAVDVSQVYPSPLPDLYEDDQITIFGRYDARGSSSLVVDGMAGGEAVRYEFIPDFAATNDDTPFIANLWARRRIDSLLAEIDERGERSDLVTEVTELATRWGIVTPYTSYLALDPNERWALEQQQNTITTTVPTRGWGAGGVRPASEPMPDDLRNNGWGAVDGDMAARTSTFDSFDEAESDNEGGVGRGFLSGNRDRAGGSVASGAAPVAAAPEMPRFTRSESGREAVEEALRRQEDATTMRVDDPTATRWASGRSFGAAGGVWIENGIEGRSADRVITAFSSEYFDLLSRNPELADVLALGAVRFTLNGEIVEIRP